MLLDVSMCPRSVVQRLWDQYQSEDSVSEDLFQADHELQHLQKTVFLSSFGTKERRTTTVPAARCRPLSKHQEEESPLLRGARNRLHNAGLYAKKTSCCAFPSTDDSEKEPLMLGKRTCFLDAATMGFCAVHRRVQIYNGE
ncbi:uncharacterized protein TNCV_757711 [Trichonephila clavipes]|nr:uncharacterized protein TNCV_757711 [Trichonephila clavipes]